MTNSPAEPAAPAVQRAQWIRDQIPEGGLFAGQQWRIATEPFALPKKLARDLDRLGRVLLQFYRAVNRLHRQSAEGKQPSWIASLLNAGKPEALLDLQRDAAFRNDVPRVIRPDILITEEGFSITELDGVPGGIGLTAWLNRVYSSAPGGGSANQVIGGPDGMLNGFAGMFGDAPKTHIVVSEESAMYRPEMNWLAGQLAEGRFETHGGSFRTPADGDAVYRFFELFDLDNVPGASALFDRARNQTIRLTPPPKPIFEEKLLFGLLWNRNLHDFWRRELGEGFFQKLRQAVPYTWILDPTPLPPHAAYPELNLTNWHQLKTLSQRQRELILKISGFAETAWGSRGVHLGSDLSQEEWSAAVDQALKSWPHSPHILQRYHKPRTVEADYLDIDTGGIRTMKGRTRLCPYYFVHGDDDAARAHLGGILATICPADKKIIHGMKDAILSPCSVEK